MAVPYIYPSTLWRQNAWGRRGEERAGEKEGRRGKEVIGREEMGGS